MKDTLSKFEVDVLGEGRERELLRVFARFDKLQDRSMDLIVRIQLGSHYHHIIRLKYTPGVHHDDFLFEGRYQDDYDKDIIIEFELTGVLHLGDGLTMEFKVYDANRPDRNGDFKINTKFNPNDINPEFQITFESTILMEYLGIDREECKIPIFFSTDLKPKGNSELVICYNDTLSRREKRSVMTDVQRQVIRTVQKLRERVSMWDYEIITDGGFKFNIDGNFDFSDPNNEIGFTLHSEENNLLPQIDLNVEMDQR